MTTRTLARVAEISALVPIDGADRIVLAQFIDSAWEVIVSKADHAVGDRGCYFEPDAFLPEVPEYEDLRKSSFRTLADGKTGFYVRTIKMRGVYSQGYFLKAERLPAGPPMNELPLHADLTAALGIQQWPEQVSLGPEQAGRFPVFIPKTDEERIENSVGKYKQWLADGLSFVWTEKLDGTSFTAFVDVNGEFGYCSRNFQLKAADSDGQPSVYAAIVKKYELEKRLREYGNGIAIQGEIIGPRVQANRYQRPDHELYLFTAWDIAQKRRINTQAVAEQLQLPTVPVYAAEQPLTERVSELRALADGPSLLHPKVEREGLVLRGVQDPSISFKVISRKFLSNQK